MHLELDITIYLTRFSADEFEFAFPLLSCVDDLFGLEDGLLLLLKLRLSNRT